MSFNTCCFVQTLLAVLAHTPGPEMTVIGRSLVSQWLCQCHHEWKWKLLNPRWLTWQSLCLKVFLTMDTKHSLCLIWLWFSSARCQKSVYIPLPAVMLSSMQRDSYRTCAVRGAVILKCPELLFTRAGHWGQCVGRNTLQLNNKMSFFKAVSTTNKVPFASIVSGWKK